MVSFSRDARIAELEMRALLFVLVAFAHVDGVFDAAERAFVRDTVDALIQRRADELLGSDTAAKSDLVPLWRQHFYHAIESIEYEIRSALTESVSEGESAGQFVAAKLKLRCFELLQRLGEENRAALIQMIDGVIRADGRVHENEARFRAELEELFAREPPRSVAESPRSRRGAALVVTDPATLPLTHPEHAFFKATEFPYARDAATFAHQAAADMDLMRKVEAQIWEQRARGQGRLASATSFAAFDGQQPFLDEFVYVVPPKVGKDYQMLVLGDLHGCYSCLKAAVMQDGFFARVDSYRRAPDRTPFPMLVLLGDYIDRGQYSYDGILRTALRLFLAAPDHVFVLRGNHEHYMTHDGRVESPVRPAEAIASIAPLAPRALLDAHARLFELLPNALVFDRTIFVHAGIPRDETLARKPATLAALNDPEVRQQMLWSDPSDADTVPPELQKACTRFSFGRAQFKRFMDRIGCSMMIRGHERVVEGLRVVYKDPEATLLSLFSAGGSTNDDLPPASNYREVTPMGLAFRYRDGGGRLTPFPIDYARYRDPAVNAFVAARGPLSMR